MEIEYPYFTVIGLSTGLIILLLIGWFVERQDDRRFGMFCIGALIAAGGFFGIHHNILEVSRLQRQAAETRAALEAKHSDSAKALKATEQQAMDQLTENKRYKTALKEAVASTLALTAGPCDAVCQESVRRVVISLPASFPPEAVTCPAPAALRVALSPLLMQGQLAAGTSPAINAVLDCVNSAQLETGQAPR